MVASYSSNLRLTKQGDNDNPNTWGQIVNNQVIELIEDAISGVVEIDVTGSSDVNISSTTVNGGYDEARNMTLELVGTIGADIDLIVPAVDKLYIINAKHTGGDITVKPSGGSSGIVFGPSQAGLVYTNGTVITSLKGLLASNNLSDLDDLSTARTNLGLRQLATLDPGSGLQVVGNQVNVTVSGLTVGDIKMWPVSTPPSSWLNCNGAAISRSTYASLFALIGTTFGTGDGSTTFNLPNFNGRSPIGIGQGSTAEGGGTGSTRTMGQQTGAETHTLASGELASHSHSAGTLAGTAAAHYHTVFSTDGAGRAALTADRAPAYNDVTSVSDQQYTIKQSSAGSDPGASLGRTSTASSSSVTISGTSSSTGGGSAHNNMHPVLGINFVIYSGV